jgi:hypothetical protein
VLRLEPPLLGRVTTGQAMDSMDRHMAPATVTTATPILIDAGTTPHIEEGCGQLHSAAGINSTTNPTMG